MDTERSDSGMQSRARLEARALFGPMGSDSVTTQWHSLPIAERTLLYCARSEGIPWMRMRQRRVTQANGCDGSIRCEEHDTIQHTRRQRTHTAGATRQGLHYGSNWRATPRVRATRRRGQGGNGRRQQTGIRREGKDETRTGRNNGGERTISGGMPDEDLLQPEERTELLQRTPTRCGLFDRIVNVRSGNTVSTSDSDHRLRRATWERQRRQAHQHQPVNKPTVE